MRTGWPRFSWNFAETSHARATAPQLLDQIVDEHMQVYVADEFRRSA